MHRLDGLAVQVEDVQRPIGSIHEVHGPKPGVGAADHFGLPVDAFRSLLESVSDETPPVNEIRLRAPYKQVPADRFGQGVAAINRQTGSGRDVRVTDCRAFGPQITRRHPPLTANRPATARPD